VVARASAELGLPQAEVSRLRPAEVARSRRGLARRGWYCSGRYDARYHLTCELPRSATGAWSSTSSARGLGRLVRTVSFGIGTVLTTLLARPPPAPHGRLDAAEARLGVAHVNEETTRTALDLDGDTGIGEMTELRTGSGPP
jgi:hypothetical protein